MALSQPPPHSLRSSEDAQDASSISRESKRRRFHPLRAVRNIFRRRLRRVESEELQQSSKKSRSTTELIEPTTKAEEKARFPPVAKVPYAVGLSVSHDSIFSPDPATISVDLAQHCADFKSELMARIHARRSSEEDEDVGLPHSPCTSPTTAEVLAHTHKSKGSSKLTTTCSAGSLLSMGSSENDEDIFGALSQNASSSRSSHVENLSSSAAEEAGSPMPLSHSAAHHKIAVRPKRNHGKPHQRKWQGQINSSNLPSTPEVCEVSLPGTSLAPEEDSQLDLSLSDTQVPEAQKPSHKKPSEGKKPGKEDSKGVFSIFSSRTKKSSEPGELSKGSSPPSEGPFFSRLFGSRRSNRKAKKGEEAAQEEPDATRSSPTKYMYTEDSQLMEDIMPITVPKPISLLDAKNSSRNSESDAFHLCGVPPSYMLKPASKKPPEKKVEEDSAFTGNMSRSVSYTNPQELEQLYSSVPTSRPFPQSSSYNLLPKCLEHQDEAASAPAKFNEQSSTELYGHEALKVPKEPALPIEMPVSPSLYRGSKISSTEDTPQSQSSVKEETEIGLKGASKSCEETKTMSGKESEESLDSLNSLDDSGSKLAESREKLLELLNPHKREQATPVRENDVPEGRRYESPIVKKVSKQALRSHSFKEVEKQSPSKTKKQATLPASMTKEEIEYYFSKGIQKELESDKVAKTARVPMDSKPKTNKMKELLAEKSKPPLPTSNVTPDSTSKGEETSEEKANGKSSETSNKDTKEACSNKAQLDSNAKDQEGMESNAKSNLLNNNTDVNQNCQAKDGENGIPKPKENKTKFTLKEGFGTRSDLPSPIKPLIFQNLNVSRPTKLDFAPPTNDSKNKTRSTPEIIPRDNSPNNSLETPTKTNEPMDETNVSLVKRNQEMFRQLENQNHAVFPNKRSSLPPKIICDKEMSFIKAARKENHATNSCQTTPCTTPSETQESELLSVFSKRTSKPKSEELAKLVSPVSEQKPGNQAKGEAIAHGEVTQSAKQSELPPIPKSMATKTTGFAKAKDEEGQKGGGSNKDLLKPKVAEVEKESLTKDQKPKALEGQKEISNKEQKPKSLENHKESLSKDHNKTKVQVQKERLNKDQLKIKTEVQKEVKKEQVKPKSVEVPKESLNKELMKPKAIETQKESLNKEQIKLKAVESQKESLNKEQVKPKAVESQKESLNKELAKPKAVEEQKEGLNKDQLKPKGLKPKTELSQQSSPDQQSGTKVTAGWDKEKSRSEDDKPPEDAAPKPKEPLQCQRSFSLKCTPAEVGKVEQPAWLKLAQQRREQRENTERLISGSSETVITTAPNPKSSRSSKVLDMVNSFQKRQLT